ncbi:hypothetical protein [Sediminibacillus massiliensis]|uniref:hypothetical protein n=1 Tax=Sediminibacillus massiliensis TaxID=1926277 RepID=UPI0009887EE0|nr:hypothetical protein [Sediminibacillus massiliensis]
MSEELLNTLIALSGLVGGGGLAVLIGYFAKKKWKRKHLLDERQEYVSTMAKAAGWNTTLVLIMIAWGLVIIFDGISTTFFIMTGLYVAHCLTLIITSAYYANQN